MREQTCCFTGHRIHKLPWGGDENHPDCIRLKQRLAAEIEMAATLGFTHFISGMAQGVDLWAAEAVLALRPSHAITLECALPFPGQAGRWGTQDSARHKSILSQCDQITMVQPEYSRSCFEQRNRYMVEKSGLIIGVYGGGRGGTQQTLRLARRSGLDVVILPPLEEGEVGVLQQLRLQG